MRLNRVACLVLVIAASLALPVGPASANHATRTIEVSPEVASRRTSESLLLTVTLSSAPTAGSAIQIDFEVETGPGNADGNTPESPDNECTIAAGTTCTATFTSPGGGNQVIRAWIDHDQNGSIVEADAAEGRYSGFYSPPAVGNDCTSADPPDTCPQAGSGTPGSVSEPDATEVVEVNWTSSPAKLDCNPENETNPASGAGSTESYTCKALDSGDNPVGGVRIDGENMNDGSSPGSGGPNDPDDSDTGSPPDYRTGRSGTPPTDRNFCTTNAAGECVGTVPASEGQAGTAHLCFWVDDDALGGAEDEFYNTGGDENDGGLCDTEAPGDPENNNTTDKVVKTWSTTAPAPTADHVHLWASGTESADCHSGLNAGNDFVPASKTLVACVHDSGHRPINELAVTFNENGPAGPDTGGVNSGSDGKARFTITSDKAGTSEVIATSSGKTSNSFTMTWQGGYWFAASDGGIFAFGDAAFHGSAGGTNLNSPIVGMSATPTGNGYRLVAADGGIFAFGDASFQGSTGSLKLNSPIVGITSTPSGNGYWMVAADGGIFSFGDASFRGSVGGTKLNSPIVGMDRTKSGNGYWLVAADGGIFAFGDAGFKGSTGGTKLNSPIVGIAATVSGDGYWFAAADGGIFAFGDASFRGSAGGTKLNSPIVGVRGSFKGNGYWMVAADGGVFSFGDSPFLGSTGDIKLNRPIVGMDKAL